MSTNPPLTALLGLTELESLLSIAYNRGACAAMRWERQLQAGNPSDEVFETIWAGLIRDCRAWGYALPGAPRNPAAPSPSV
jgi:hypothetical protein